MSTYSAQVLSNASLQGYWKLDETSGTSAADSKGTDTGTYNGSITRYTSGMADGAACSYVTLGTSGCYVSTNTVRNYAQATVEAWIYLTATPGGTAKVAGFSNGNGSPTTDKVLYIDSAGKVNWYVYDSATKTVTSPSALSLNTWHHLVGTADGVTSTLYIDGTSVGSIAAGNTYTGYTVGSFIILGTSGVAGTLSGAMVDEVAVYNAALSSAAVSANFAAATVTNPPGGNTRVTQLAAETLVAPTPATRVTQLATETLVTPTPATRITQLAAETLVTPTPATRMTQSVVEVLVRNPQPSFAAYIID